MSTELETDERTKWSPWALAAAALLLLMFGVIAVGMFRGCFFVDPQEVTKREEERKKEEEKKKQAEYVIAAPVVQPAELESPLSFVKPGHWATASQMMTANFRDFIGDSRTMVTNSQNLPYPLENTPFVLHASRPVLLNKGRAKTTECTFFVPPTDQAMRLFSGLEERGLGAGFRQGTPLTRMPSYQYHFVVLAKEPSRYGYIKSLDSVQVPFDGESDADETEDPIHYRIVQLDATKSIPLSDNPLTWTSIAYILWDEVDPRGTFSAEQERALVDWLHWGGQLIVSGPDSLDLLKGSFLEPYLPATNGGKRTITGDDKSIAELNGETDEGWLVSSQSRGGEPLRPTVPWSAIKLDVHPQATALRKTGGLFVERQVGRGRIVVSAVQLAERDLINWRSGFQSLFNACLMRRPRREYRPGYFGDVTLTWADADLKDRRLDARLNTRLQYVARDLGVETAYRYEDVRDDSGQIVQFNQLGQPQMIRTYRPSEAVGGVAAWNDFSAAANAARDALREAAGVEVPGAGFVVLCLATYLIALVPLNWLVFHTLGRVEWAWIAAPIIAVIGTVVIVERARLDIGFVRAQTEIGLLEQQPDHPRAHLSRYTALYTSLSTTYDVEYGNLTSLVAPFPTSNDYEVIRGQGFQSVDFQRYDSVRLAGLPVSSNSTGMVHSEQMVTLDGAIHIGESVAGGGEQIVNGTNFELNSACVVRRPTPEEAERTTNTRKLEGMWIGRMLPGQSVRYSEPMFKVANAKAPFAEERVAEARLQRGERLNLEPMFRLALAAQHLEAGEVRLVARVDEVLPGQAITPTAAQVRGATLVVAHLKYAPLPPPQRDVNTKRDVKADAEEAIEDEFNFN